MQSIENSGLKPLKTQEPADERVCIEFTPQEVIVLAQFLTDGLGGSNFDPDEIEEEYGAELNDAIGKVMGKADEQNEKPKMAYLPASAFPPGMTEWLFANGLARPCTKEEAMEAMRREQS